MTGTESIFDSANAELAHLTALGVLGFYTHFEVTEVFAYRKGEAPLNILSVLVAEERIGNAEPPKLLGDRVRLKSLKDWTFGIQRSLRPIAELEPMFRAFCESGEWCPSGKQLQVGKLIPVPTQFVPPDSTTLTPLNNVLKNNFWSGSYLIELADPKKTSLPPLFDDPPLLQELSEAIQRRVPIKLASLSDRLGNVVIQLPVTLIIGRFGRNRLTGASIITLRWHPKATPRPLPIYQDASDAKHGIKVIMYFSAQEHAHVEGILGKLKLTGHEDIVLIDARADNKPSGSKA
jgi:hypothetical protein